MMFDACSSCCLLPDIFKKPPSQWFSQFSSVPRPMRNGRWSTPPVTMEPNCRSRGAVSSRGLWGFWDGFFNGYSRLTHQIMVGDFSLWSNLGVGVCEFLFSWWMNMPSNETSLLFGSPAERYQGFGASHSWRKSHMGHDLHRWIFVEDQIATI